MRPIDADELLNDFDKLDLDYGAMGGVAECIAITEHAPTIEPNKSRPYGDCTKCTHVYGTLGCCTTVSNEWVYDCDNGMAQYEKNKAEPSKSTEQNVAGVPSGDFISRQWLLDLYEIDTTDFKETAKVPLEVIIQNIKDAPSVSIQPKTIANDCDLISRADAIEAIRTTKIVFDSPIDGFVKHDITDLVATVLTEAFEALPSADRPKVIRSKTLMPTKDFKEWAKRIREVNPNAVVIPCDAEVVSAEAVPKGENEKW